MSFRSRVDASHARIVGHSVYSQHVCRRPRVNRVQVGITAEIIEAGYHRVLESLVDNVLAPEVSHSVLHPFKI